jgi:hypothetical protein
MFSMILLDSRQFFDKIRSGQFVGQNSGDNAYFTSREKLYISKTVPDSDLQSSPVVSMVFKDNHMMYPASLRLPPSLSYAQNSLGY